MTERSEVGAVGDTDTKPRTAREVATLCRRYPIERPPTSSAPTAVQVLESWRRELLADGWTYLPELPLEGAEVLGAIQWASGRTKVRAVFRHGDSFRFPSGYKLKKCHVYAWRPLPEPPPVREG